MKSSAKPSRFDQTGEKRPASKQKISFNNVPSILNKRMSGNVANVNGNPDSARSKKSSHRSKTGGNSDRSHADR